MKTRRLLFRTVAVLILLAELGQFAVSQTTRQQEPISASAVTNAGKITTTARYFDPENGLSADAAVAYRTSRYSAASVPRDEELLELTLVARRAVGRNWTVGFEYLWFENDSTVEDFAYDGQRFVLGLSRGFYGR